MSVGQPQTLQEVVLLLVARFDALEAKLDAVVQDHEARLRRLESWSYAIPAAALVSIGSVIAAVVAAFH